MSESTLRGFRYRLPGWGVGRRVAAGVVGCAVVVSAPLLAGCGGGSGGAAAPANAERLLLAGPHIDIAVTIPAGWHQVIDSGNPSVPEMVSPITCLGSGEVACAKGLARLATLTAPSAQAAALAVQQAVTAAPGLQVGAITSQGPGKVGHRDGYRLRFDFSNSRAKLVSEVAAVPTGSVTPDAKGNREFSVVLVWISDAAGAPNQNVINQIISSALVVGGQP